MKDIKKTVKGEICIQYIFSAFNENLEYANRYMIAIYQENLPPKRDNPPNLSERETIPLWRGQGEVAWQLYTEWFEKGKALKERFFENLQLDISNPAIETEFQRHESWKEKTQLRATPTILVNGYKLPDNYKIEDIRYFTKFDVNIK